MRVEIIGSGHAEFGSDAPERGPDRKSIGIRPRRGRISPSISPDPLPYRAWPPEAAEAGGGRR